MNRSKVNKYARLAELKSLLRKRKIPYKKMAKIIGISTNSFFNKINGYNAFDVLEMDKVAEYLEIRPVDITKYFFPKYLPKRMPT